MSVHSTSRVLIAALALVAVAAPAHAQSTEDATTPIAPVTPIPPAPQVMPSEGPPTPPSPSLTRASDAPPRGLVASPEPAKPHVPLAKRWWFWAGLGAAAVGVVLAAIFVGPRDPYNGNANPGTVEFF